MRWPAEWREPAALRLLEGSPINCLVADQAAGGLAQVLEEAHKRGLTVVRPGETSVAWLSRSEVSRKSASSVLAFNDNVWPSIKLSEKGDLDSASAGPTGNPWVDSNTWFVQLARTVAPEQAVWAVADPPEKVILSAGSYETAIADAAARGGRWLVSLDGRLLEGLATGTAQALSVWRRINQALAFFERHKDWQAWPPAGFLAVLSDFTGPNEFLSMEALNLISRRQLPIRIVDRMRPNTWSWDGLRAVLDVDQEPPAPELREKLLAFAASGGLLICPPAWSKLISGRLATEVQPKFRIHQVGKGRVAVSKADFDDPYLLAADAQALLSRRNDMIRLWNAPSALVQCAAARGGRRAIVQLVSYSGRPSEFITLGVLGRWRSARFWTVEANSPVLLKATSVGGMTEFHLPPVSVYAAVELEGV